jgi:hypothetical protein
MNYLEAPSSRNLSAELSKRGWVLCLLGVTLLALSLRLNFVLNAVVDHPIRNDAAQYFSAAWNLVHNHTFSMAPPGAPSVSGDSFRDPGLPVLLAGWLWLFGDVGPWLEATLITQALLGTLTVPLLLSAAHHRLSDRWLIAAGLLMAIWPHSITTCGYLLTETLLGFLCALSLWLLSHAINQKHYGWFIASGLCFGAAGLTNAVLAPFAPLLAIGMLVLRRLDKKFALALALSGLLLPLGWQLRNHQLQQVTRSSSDRALVNLVQGSWPQYHSSWRASALGDPEGKRIQQHITDEYVLLRDRPSLGVKAISHRFAEAPLHYLWWYLSKPALLWGWSIQIGQGNIYIYATDNSPFDYNPLLGAAVAVCYILNPAFALLAAWCCLRTLLKPSDSPDVIVAMVLLGLYATLIYSLLQAEPRYAIPFRGIEMALAIVGLWQMVQWWRQRMRYRRLARNRQMPTAEL